ARVEHWPARSAEADAAAAGAVAAGVGHGHLVAVGDVAAQIGELVGADVTLANGALEVGPLELHAVADKREAHVLLATLCRQRVEIPARGNRRVPDPRHLPVEH